jgi:hypothetical protein
MTQQDDLIAYRNRFRAVDEVERKEQREASIELKWKQLNSIIRLAIGLGIFKADPSEVEVYQRWAKIKDKAERTNASFHPDWLSLWLHCSISWNDLKIAV